MVSIPHKPVEMTRITNPKRNAKDFQNAPSSTKIDPKSTEIGPNQYQGVKTTVEAALATPRGLCRNFNVNNINKMSEKRGTYPKN